MEVKSLAGHKGKIIATFQSRGRRVRIADQQAELCDAYIDDHLIVPLPSGGQLSSAAIVGSDGGVWAQSDTFPEASEQELSTLWEAFTDQNVLPGSLRFGGAKYMLIAGDPGSVIRGKLSQSGIVVKKTNTAMVIGLFDEGVQPGDCNVVVENLGDYLIEAQLRAVPIEACQLAFAGGINGVCFDRECAEAADRVFAAVIAAPLVGLFCAILYALRPGADQEDGGFEDPDTGAVFKSMDGTLPERDRKGELAFRAVSYTPWPVEQGFEGERVRIRVGAVREPQLRTYVFEKKLRQPSKIINVVLPRPLGIVFEEDARRQRVVVESFIPGSHADKLAKVAKMTQRDAAQPGDVLRAFTCTNFVFPTNSLFGAKPPVRTRVVYGADGERWPKVIAALRKGDIADGDVHLVLERQLVRQAEQ